jgi:hypothetical protein
MIHRGGMMDGFECEECKAVYQELRKAAETLGQHQARYGNTSAALASFIEGLDDEECTRIREASPLWKAWRRLREHRNLTGHFISVLPIPPSAISNPN